MLSSYPEVAQPGLMALRDLIFETAAETEGVGSIEETLHWGQPSYLTSETGSGSTIRIGALGDSEPSGYAMYFICTTNLVDTFKSAFGETFAYDGNRALLFRSDEPVPQSELRECIAMALTYHSSKA